MDDSNHSWRQVAWTLFWGATAVVVTSTMLGFLARWGWFFELFSHFRVQYFLALLAAAVLLLLLRRFRWAAVIGLFALLNLVQIAPIYWPDNSPRLAGERQPIRVASLNVYSGNRQFETVLNYLRETKPDVAVLIEVSPPWAEALEELDQEFPHSRVIPRRDNYGIAVLSRLPLEEVTLATLGPYDVPAIVARIAPNGQPLTLIAVHTSAPMGPTELDHRNEELAELAQLTAQVEQPLLVIGDLNTTGWSPYFQDFVEQSGLRDSRQGFGIQPSWPTKAACFWIPLDHCLISGELSVRDRWVGPDIGSDHYPIVLDLELSAASN